MNKDSFFFHELNNLIYKFSRLPGIGPKSAKRIAFHLLSIGKEEVLEIAEAIKSFKLSLRLCRKCGFPSEHEHCPFCDSNKRDNSQICIVEKPQDVLSIEETSMYQGQYHCLGGVISPLQGIEVSDLRYEELLSRIKSGDYKEAILALNPTMEGEATSLFIAEKLKNLGLKTLRLSQGLPIGADLEFADSLTLSKAILNRVEF